MRKQQCCLRTVFTKDPLKGKLFAYMSECMVLHLEIRKVCMLVSCRQELIACSWKKAKAARHHGCRASVAWLSQEWAHCAPCGGSTLLTQPPAHAAWQRELGSGWKPRSPLTFLLTFLGGAARRMVPCTVQRAAISAHALALPLRGTEGKPGPNPIEGTARSRTRGLVFSDLFLIHLCSQQWRANGSARVVLPAAPPRAKDYWGLALSQFVI